MIVVNTRFFGICGFCRSGKDYFFSLLREKLGQNKVFRFSFGDFLKEELAPLIKDKFEIDIFNCPPEYKEKIRPLLVAWAAIHRYQSNGQYYIRKLSEQLTKELTTGKYQDKIICFTDLRFFEWPYDEVHWIKDLYGKIVYIDKYSYNRPLGIKFKKFIGPPNKEEAMNCAKIKEIADYKISWENNNKIAAEKEVDKFIKYYKL